jgi:hypothetical protein
MTPIRFGVAHTAAKPAGIESRSQNPERRVNMADTDDYPVPELSDLARDRLPDGGDGLDEVRRSLQETIDETDRAIAKHARHLKDKISEIEAMLGASVWRNPFL